MMSDVFVCSENEEHVHDVYTGQVDNQAWYVCITHGHDQRVKAANGSVLNCELETCGFAAAEHPSLAQRMKSETEGFTIAQHVYRGNGGPCTHQVALAKLIGYRCVDCGGLIQGMPTKDE